MDNTLPNIIHVLNPDSSQHHSILLVGEGTEGSYTMARTVMALTGYEVGDELLAAVLPNWNQEIFTIIEKIKGAVRTYAPQRMLKELPKGFRNDPKLAERSQHEWGPQVTRFMEEAHRESTRRGLVCGLVLHCITGGGGHIPVVREAVRQAKQHFPEALHMGIYFIPSDDRGLLRNLAEYATYPDDLAIPIIVADNRHRQLIDWAIPMLMALLVTAQRYADQKQHSPIENLARVARESQVMGVSAAFVELPIVPLRWYQKPFMVEGVAKPEVPVRLAEVLASVLQPPAQLLAGVIPDPDDVAFLGLGGLPVPQRGNRVDDLPQDVQRQVRHLAESKLQELGQRFPGGTSVIWSPIVEVNARNRFTRMPAVWVWPIRGARVRDFIDPLIKRAEGNVGTPLRGNRKVDFPVPLLRSGA